MLSWAPFDHPVCLGLGNQSKIPESPNMVGVRLVEIWPWFGCMAIGLQPNRHAGLGVG